MIEVNEIIISKESQIFLIGFMGVGKTYLGEKLARRLDMDFHDIDREIEKEAELDVNDIFKLKGEQVFRELESNILKKWDKPGIISTGGGIVEFKENREIIRSKQTVWLNPPWKVIRSRILNSYRPLVLDRSENELYAIWEKRKALYSECTDVEFTINNIDELIKLIT